jgi:hypothetical protein
MFLFLRLWRLSRPACLFGALAFALSGTQLSILYAGHTNNVMAIAMIPWAFWGMALALRDARPTRGVLVLGTALALQVLSLGMQVGAYTLLGLAAFGAADPLAEAARPLSRRGWRCALLLACALCLAFLLSAPQLLPTLQYKAYSLRERFSYEDFTSWSFPPRESLTWFLPGAFGWLSPAYHGEWPFCLSSEYFGLLPWMLALAAAFGRERRRGFVFFAGLASFSFLAALGKWTPLHLVFYHLPVFSGFRTWARFLCLLTFSVCALAAMGWETLAKRSPAGIPSRAVALAGLMAFHLWDVHGMHRRFLVFVDPGPYIRRPVYCENIPDPAAAEPFRVDEEDDKVWGPNRGMLWGYESASGYHGLPLHSQAALAEKMKARPGEYRRLLGVRAVLSREGKDVQVTRTEGLGRAFLVPRARAVPTAGEALDAMGDTSLAVDRETVWTGPPLEGGGAGPEGEVRWISRDAGGFELSVSTPLEQALIVSQAWYPGWKAWIDREETAVYLADGALQGIRVARGVHKVVFRFESPAFNMGRWLAGLGLVLGMGMLFL